MTKSEKLKKCIGCEQNFYNGNNNLGVSECWSLKSMKIIRRKRVGTWQTPPWTQKAVRVPSCYRQKGYVFVGPDQEY